MAAKMSAAPFPSATRVTPATSSLMNITIFVLMIIGISKYLNPNKSEIRVRIGTKKPSAVRPRASAR